eukprot:1316943-Pyramimonas_sp.AAC.1
MSQGQPSPQAKFEIRSSRAKKLTAPMSLVLLWFRVFGFTGSPLCHGWSRIHPKILSRTRPPYPPGATGESGETLDYEKIHV